MAGRCAWPNERVCAIQFGRYKCVSAYIYRALVYIHTPRPSFSWEKLSNIRTARNSYTPILRIRVRRNYNNTRWPANGTGAIDYAVLLLRERRNRRVAYLVRFNRTSFTEHLPCVPANGVPRASWLSVYEARDYYTAVRIKLYRRECRQTLYTPRRIM